MDVSARPTTAPEPGTAKDMEYLWSPAGATGGNRSQMRRARKPLKQADPQPAATHGNRFGAHRKEGSTVRVRQRALQKRRTSALLCSHRPALDPACGGYGAVYGALKSKTLAVARRGSRRHLPARRMSRLQLDAHDCFRTGLSVA
jgi:hypothetical protein